MKRYLLILIFRKIIVKSLYIFSQALAFCNLIIIKSLCKSPLFFIAITSKKINILYEQQSNKTVRSIQTILSEVFLKHLLEGQNLVT